MLLNSNWWVKFGTSWALGVSLIAGQFGVARGQDLNGTHAASKEPNSADYDLNELARTEQQARSARKMKNAGLIVAGSSYGLAAFLVTTSFISGKAMHQFLGSSGADSSSSNSNRHWLPLYVPLAGPIWSLTYSDVNSETGNVIWLSVFGVGQFLGTGLYIYGLSETPTSKPLTTAGLRISVLPILSPNAPGLMAAGTF